MTYKPNPWEIALNKVEDEAEMLINSAIVEKKANDREDLLYERADINAQIQAVNKGAPADSVRRRLAERTYDHGFNDASFKELARIEGHQIARLQAINSIQSNIGDVFKTEDIGRSNSKNVEDIYDNILGTINSQALMLGDATSTRLTSKLDEQTELLKVNRSLLNKHPDFIPDDILKPETLGYQIDPNMQGASKLQQTLDLLESGGDAKTSRMALSGVSQAQPEVINRGDDIYTQVPTRAFNQMTPEQQQGLASLQDKPGMQFLKNDRYKPIEKKDTQLSAHQTNADDGTQTITTTFQLADGKTWDDMPIGGTRVNDQNYTMITSTKDADPTDAPQTFKYDKKWYMQVPEGTENAVGGDAIGKSGQFYLETAAPGSSGSGKSREAMNFEILANKQNQSYDIYKLLTGTEDLRKKLPPGAIDLSVLSQPKGGMNAENSNKVQFLIGRELVKYAQAGEQVGTSLFGTSGMEMTDNALMPFLEKNGNMEKVAEYYHEEGTKNDEGEWVLPSGTKTEFSLESRFDNLDVKGSDKKDPHSWRLIMKQLADDYAMHDDVHNIAAMDLSTANRTKGQLEDAVTSQYNIFLNKDKNDKEKTKSRKLMSAIMMELKRDHGYTDEEWDTLIANAKTLGTHQ